MNVTSVEWRDSDPRDGRLPYKRPPRHVPEPADSGDEDIIEIHGEEDDEADGLDQFA